MLHSLVVALALIVLAGCGKEISPPEAGNRPSSEQPRREVPPPAGNSEVEIAKEIELAKEEVRSQDKVRKKDWDEEVFSYESRQFSEMRLERDRLLEIMSYKHALDRAGGEGKLDAVIVGELQNRFQSLALEAHTYSRRRQVGGTSNVRTARWHFVDVLSAIVGISTSFRDELNRLTAEPRFLSERNEGQRSFLMYGRSGPVDLVVWAQNVEPLLRVMQDDPVHNQLYCQLDPELLELSQLIDAANSGLNIRDYILPRLNDGSIGIRHLSGIVPLYERSIVQLIKTATHESAREDRFATLATLDKHRDPIQALEIAMAPFHNLARGVFVHRIESATEHALWFHEIVKLHLGSELPEATAEKFSAIPKDQELRDLAVELWRRTAKGENPEELRREAQQKVLRPVVSFLEHLAQSEELKKETYPEIRKMIRTLVEVHQRKQKLPCHENHATPDYLSTKNKENSTDPELLRHALFNVAFLNAMEEIPNTTAILVVETSENVSSWASRESVEQEVVAEVAAYLSNLSFFLGEDLSGPQLPGWQVYRQAFPKGPADEVVSKLRTNRLEDIRDKFQKAMSELPQTEENRHKVWDDMAKATGLQSISAYLP